MHDILPCRITPSPSGADLERFTHVHRRIAEAVADGDADVAVRLTARHLDANENMGPALGRHPPLSVVG
jgi:DNA-binding GntR family transcriptional regulator